MERASGNEILDSLDAKEADVLHAAAESVPLPRGAVVGEGLGPSSYVYFPTEGVLSVMGITGAGATVEVAVLGREAMVDSTLLGQGAGPFRVVAQVPSHALRVPGDVVRRVAAECGDLHHRRLAATEHLLSQVAQSAICNRFHNSRQRLARWLLMIGDRTGTREIAVTHELIAEMVGGPRSAVTEAASDLRDVGAIEYRRGVFEIIDAEELLAHSCECYEALQRREEARAGVGVPVSW